MFDFVQLRCFVAVADELHFGRAAAQVHMTQPPFSRQIQRLEQILDAKLLDRTSRTVRLTPAGKSFLPSARRLLKLAESVTNSTRRVAQGKSGSLRIGYTAATAYRFLPDLIKLCHSELSQLDLALSEMVSQEQIEAVTTGRIDVGIARPPVSRAEFFTECVVAEPLLVAMAADHPLTQQDSVPVKSLDQLPFIMYSPFESRYFYNLLAAIFASDDVFPQYIQSVSQIHSILALVRVGLGLAIVPLSAAALHYEGVELRPLQSAAPTLAELVMFWRRDNDNPMLPHFVDLSRTLAPLRS